MAKLSIAVVIFLSAMVSLLFSMKSNKEKSKTDLSFRFYAYKEIYRQAEDSLVHQDKEYSLALDSLFYFHPGENSFVTCLYKSVNGKSFSDEMCFVYGEKIAGRWFFFKGSSYSLPRALFNNNDSVPLCYRQFHTAALEDVFYPFALGGNFDFKNSPFFVEASSANNTKLMEKF